jgi:hypothetical protein
MRYEESSSLRIVSAANRLSILARLPSDVPSESVITAAQVATKMVATRIST